MEIALTCPALAGWEALEPTRARPSVQSPTLSDLDDDGDDDLLVVVSGASVLGAWRGPTTTTPTPALGRPSAAATGSTKCHNGVDEPCTDTGDTGQQGSAGDTGAREATAHTGAIGDAAREDTGFEVGAADAGLKAHDGDDVASPLGGCGCGTHGPALAWSLWAWLIRR